MKMNFKKFELPFHVVKRSVMPLWKSVLIRLITALFALLFCSILAIFMIEANPFDFIATMFEGVFYSTGLLLQFLKDTAILLCIALAITPAFKMRFWNIGAEGQTLVGALASVGVIIYCKGLPEWLILILMFVASLLAGAIWAGIPAVFKALWGTNETLFTLMMNYVATGITSFFLLVWSTGSGGAGGSGVVPVLSSGHLPVIGHEYLLLMLLVLLLTFALYIYQKYTKQGYEISVVGESENTAKYIGINVKKVIIRTLLISGAICGFAGFLIVGALDHTVSASATVAGRGFTAIMVSWLAKFNPLIMIGTAAFITFLKIGAGQIATNFDIDSSFPDMVIGIVLFFIIGCEFFINYQLKLKSRESASKEKIPEDTVKKTSEGGSEQ